MLIHLERLTSHTQKLLIFDFPLMREKMIKEIGLENQLLMSIFERTRVSFIDCSICDSVITFINWNVSIQYFNFVSLQVVVR
jgi:hypothetical protein